MSRSYKKHPWITDHHVKTSSEMKKFANKKVRHTKDLPNGKAFKKVSESYDLCDWRYRWTKQEAIDEYYRSPFLQEQYTIKEWLKYWKKMAFRK